VRVEVRARWVRINKNDALAELREVNREVYGNEALANAAAPAAYSDNSPCAAKMRGDVASVVEVVVVIARSLRVKRSPLCYAHGEEDRRSARRVPELETA
jgi:hypothetical protein